ncbi:3-deoxy-manno-octulosonate cytidylyltransferase [Aestuariispira insulae]|uniref:3-deoxy-manno-octulosonate cytidylyltransferase n=1 Tax=Aestuariispira insulae TaxID=1461337 RepID=UPI003CCC75EF
MKSLIVIPARLAASRLPNKPLADIGGEPMIVHCWRRAIESQAGEVVIAAGDPEIVEAIEKVGGKAVLTDPNHPSGSDRVWEAVQRMDPNGDHDVIVNVQGDLPTLDPSLIQASLAPLKDPGVDIATLVCEITEAEECTNPNVVKAYAGFKAGETVTRALTFTRATAPYGDGPLYHHIGLYAYRRAALERFVALPQGVLEQREKLEQLRALENGMRIDVSLAKTVPLGVDTPADLERARVLLTP